eukprot:TRINITY_DN9375_c0_g1_i2.p2 TRINITY_DN9375_c0_g1~~TRINITY_DN9375_c0_g1_i2.p2  ORF type:complete len:134 (+),score=26.13 TRINITY_DN9375_c0_g1_i2:66-467(+)
MCIRDSMKTILLVLALASIAFVSALSDADCRQLKRSFDSTIQAYSKAVNAQEQRQLQQKIERMFRLVEKACQPPAVPAPQEYLLEADQQACQQMRQQMNEARSKAASTQDKFVKQRMNELVDRVGRAYRSSGC